MNPRRYALVAFAVLAAIFVASNMIVSSWFGGARLDFTENRLYTLSKGARTVLRELNEPITLTYFYSRDAAAQNPELRDYGVRVRGLLLAFERRSGGKVRVLEVNPEPFSEAEDQAQFAGMEPFQTGAGGDPLYLGILGVNAVDERAPIPQLSPAREAYLEYELTRLITELESPSRLKVGLITSLPWDPALSGQMLPGMAPPPLVLTELMRGWTVVKVPGDFAALDPTLDLLVIVHPPSLTDTQVYAIDQFLMARGRAFIALDPAALTAGRAGGFEPQPAPTASSLDTLLSAWGVSMSAEAVVDVRNALQVQAMGPDGQPLALPQPLFFAVPKSQAEPSDLLTTAIERGLYFGAPGALDWTKKEGVTVTPLMQTSPETSRFPAAQATMQTQPQDLLRNFASTGKVETIVARITGKIGSAYGATRPAGVTSDLVHKAQADSEAVILLASDTDFLTDDFYLSPPPQRVPMMDNGAFFINAIDQLSGNANLISLRARAPSQRRMGVVDRIRADAQRDALTMQEKLQADLAQTEQELRDIAERGDGSGFFAGNLNATLTSEERTKLEDLRGRALEARGELRRVRRAERVALERMEGWLALVNVWLAPLTVLGGGLFWLWRRQRRQGATVARGEVQS